MAIERDEQIIESTQESQQAETKPNVRDVLVASMSLVIVALVLAWLVFGRA